METWGYQPCSTACGLSMGTMVRKNEYISVGNRSDHDNIRHAESFRTFESETSAETELYRRHGYQNSTGFAVHSKQLYSDVFPLRFDRFALYAGYCLALVKPTPRSGDTQIGWLSWDHRLLKHCDIEIYFTCTSYCHVTLFMFHIRNYSTVRNTSCISMTCINIVYKHTYEDKTGLVCFVCSL